MTEAEKTLALNVGGQKMEIPLNRQSEFISTHVAQGKAAQAGHSEISAIEGSDFLNTHTSQHEGHPGELAWRILTIQSEFVKGHDFLKQFDKAVSIFGSARMGFGDEVYREAEAFGAAMAKAGFAVFTGGGPGVMEAGNKGAKLAGGRSVGININLPGKDGATERRNEFITEAESFDYFFSRKVILSFASQFYAFFPGGFGTLDELFEMLTLVQTGKTSRIPIVLVNKEYWTPLIDWIKSTVYEKNNAISEKDLDLFTVVDTAEEAIAYIEQCVE